MNKTNTNISEQVVRKTSLKCLSLGEEAYSFAKQMAEEDSLSCSAFLRGLIKKTYLKWSRNKKKEVVGVE